MARKKAPSRGHAAYATTEAHAAAEDPTEFNPSKLEQPAAPVEAPAARGAGPAEERQPGEDQLESPLAERPFVAVAAPPRGAGLPITIDNRVGYRKEDSPDGRKRQIRFADREGGQRPDDELLEPLRKRKPVVSWQAREKAWQARKDVDGLQALDKADQELAAIGRKRSAGRTP